MDKELATYISKVAFRSASELNDLIPLLKKHCNEEEYKLFARAIAETSAKINLKI